MNVKRSSWRMAKRKSRPNVNGLNYYKLCWLGWKLKFGNNQSGQFDKKGHVTSFSGRPSNHRKSVDKTVWYRDKSQSFNNTAFLCLWRIEVFAWALLMMTYSRNLDLLVFTWTGPGRVASRVRIEIAIGVPDPTILRAAKLNWYPVPPIRPVIRKRGRPRAADASGGKNTGPYQCPEVP